MIALGTSSAELDSIISFQPRTKEDFYTLSSRIIEYTIKRHQNKPLYAAFVEHHVRQLAMPLKDVEIRKAASGLTTLANEKQKEQREKASGKKKPKAATKPALGAAKASNRCAYPLPSCATPSDDCCFPIGLILICTTSHWMTLGPTQMISCRAISRA